MDQCLRCNNHSVKDGRHYCNDRIARTQKGLLCYCDIPCEKAVGTHYCTFTKRPSSRPLTKEAKR